jgi:CheY-like chemotaxis protein
LLVDDRKACCDTMGMLLEALGIPTATAYCGMDAIRLAKELRPDFILLDIMMEDMDGWEVARVPRKWTRLSSGRSRPCTSWGNCCGSGMRLRPQPEDQG